MQYQTLDLILYRKEKNILKRLLNKSKKDYSKKDY